MARGDGQDDDGQGRGCRTWVRARGLDAMTGPGRAWGAMTGLWGPRAWGAMTGMWWPRAWGAVTGPWRARAGGAMTGMWLPRAGGAVTGPWRARGLALALVLTAACTPIYSNHGYIPEETDLAALKIGVDTRDSVAAFFGRPSAEGVLGDTEWFYVESRWKTSGARAPQETDRQVVAISFDAKGNLANVERFGLDKGEVVAISRRITTEPIKGRSALAQIFANLGHIDPASLLKK